MADFPEVVIIAHQVHALRFLGNVFHAIDPGCQLTNRIQIVVTFPNIGPFGEPALIVPTVQPDVTDCGRGLGSWIGGAEDAVWTRQ